MLSQWIDWAVDGVCDWDEDTQIALRTEYDELRNDEEQTQIFNLQKFLRCTDMELQQVKVIADQLRIDPHPELIAILNGSPYFVNLPFTNVNADIDRMLAIYKSKYLKLKVKEAEYLRYFDKPKQTATKLDWYGQLRVLSKFNGYKIQATKTSVLEYVDLLNNFKAENKPK